MATKRKAPPLKTRDQLAQAAFNRIKNMKQNQDKLNAGEIGVQDIWLMAYDSADNAIQKQLAESKGLSTDNLSLLNNVNKYRQEQEAKYRTLFEWNTANDEATLRHILDTEAHIYEIELELDDGTGKSAGERQKLMKQHSDLADKHKDFLVAAGIDRLSREKKKATNEPFEDWIRIKRLGDEKMQQLKRDFAEDASKSRNEFELRHAIKHHFGYEFSIVDAILSHHRRVLGLNMSIDEEQGA